MVLVPPDHARDPVDVRRQVLGHVADVVGVGVALDVGLVDDEQPSSSAASSSAGSFG
jgi:hypothetical protein